MKQILLVAAMIMSTMAINLSIYQKSADFATASDGMKKMQNLLAKTDKNEEPTPNNN